MEKKNFVELKNIKKQENVHVYKQGKSTITVHREFCDNGSKVLEQVVSILLDMLDKQEN